MRYLLMFVATCWLGALHAQTGTVVIKIKGVDTKLGGEVTAGLFTKDNFPVVGKSSYGSVAEASAATVEITLIK